MVHLHLFLPAMMIFQSNQRMHVELLIHLMLILAVLSFYVLGWLRFLNCIIKCLGCQGCYLISRDWIESVERKWRAVET